MIEIEVEWTYEQYFECNRLFCLKTTWSRRFCYFLIKYGYPVLAAVLAFAAVFSWITMGRLNGIIVFNAFWSGFLLWCRFRYATNVRKMYERQEKNLSGTIKLTPDGLRFERKNGSANTDYTWKGMEGWLERPEMFMVFPGPLSFFRIPKDKLTSVERDETRSWLSESLKQIG